MWSLSSPYGSKDAYGDQNPQAIIELDKKIFEVEGKVDEEMLKVGNPIPMQNDQGQPLSGMVREIKEDKVLMDFNHPLAGVN